MLALLGLLEIQIKMESENVKHKLQQLVGADRIKNWDEE